MAAKKKGKRHKRGIRGLNTDPGSKVSLTLGTTDVIAFILGGTIGYFAAKYINAPTPSVVSGANDCNHTVITPQLARNSFRPALSVNGCL